MRLPRREEIHDPKDVNQITFHEMVGCTKETQMSKNEIMDHHQHAANTI